MTRKVLERVLTAVLVVAIAALAVIVGPRLLPVREGDAFGGPPADPSPAQPMPSPTAEPVASGCFDPTASPDPVVFTNPDGPAGDGHSGGNSFVAAARDLPTFAGIWVNDFRRQIHVALTCDVEGAVDAIGHLVPRDREIHFRLVEYTYSELERIRDAMFADRDALMEEGIYLGYGGIDEVGNRVEMGIDPFTPAVTLDLRRRYGEPIEFGHAPRPEPVATRPPGGREVLVAVVAPPDETPMVTCGGEPFPADVLDEPGVEDVPADMAADLAAAARYWASEFRGIQELTWRLAHRDEASAAFIGRRDGDVWTYLSLERDAEGWAPSGAGDCRPTPVVGEFGPATWWLDPGFPTPTADATELHILVMEQACASGEQAFGRIEAPLAEYGADSLTLRIGVRSHAGFATCPSHPPTPATVILPEPLGDRTLLDGGRHPPAPPTPDD